jgi:gas vesicle protein
MGALVGAGLALIFAPMAGRDTRRHIGETARKLKDGATGHMEGMKHAIKEGANELHAAVDAGKDTFRRTVDKSPLERDRVSS